VNGDPVLPCACRGESGAPALPSALGFVRNALGDDTEDPTNGVENNAVDVGQSLPRANQQRLYPPRMA